MVQPKEGQLGPITILDEDSEGIVVVSGADVTEVGSIIYEAREDAPTTTVDTGAFWVENTDPTVPKFTNSDGVSLTLGVAGDIALHADTHEVGGSDELDGYNLVLSYSPNNYNPPVNNIIGEHFHSIDQTLSSFSVGIDSHADTHEAGGSDEIDGYNLTLNYTPSNYDTPINDITGEHIAAIDDKLGSVISNGSGVYYVDADVGDDSNPGTIGSPFETLDAALRALGPIISEDSEIHLNATSVETGYETDELWKPRTYIGNLLIVGDEYVEVESATALTSYTSSGRVYNFSGATPGWTVDEFAGYYLQFVSGSSIVPNQCRLIVRNTADTIVVANRHVSVAFAGPQPSDVFRVVRPAVVINATEKILDIDQYAGPGNTLYGGMPSGNDIYESLNHCLKLRNLDFALETGQSTQSLQLSGTFEIDGCFFSKNSTNRYLIQLNNGIIHSGIYKDDDVQSVSMGYCLSMIDRGGNARLPCMSLRNSVFEGGISCGVFEASSQSHAFFRDLGSRFDGRGLTNTYPHGAVYCGKGCNIILSNGANPNIFIYNIGTTDYDFECENGMLEIYSVINHLGAGGFARSRHGGIVNIASAPIITGTGARIDALYNSDVRIIGINGSTLGPAQAGQTFPVTRVAGAWEVNEIITGSESCSIYRTS
jgi:hypothetical protein